MTFSSRAGSLPLHSLCWLTLSASLPSQAGGLDTPAIAVSGMSTAGANSAEANDASVIYYNPAGMTRLKGTQVSISLIPLTLQGKVRDDGTTRTPPPGTDNQSNGAPIANDPQAQGDAGTFWPKVLATGSFFASTPIDESLTMGLGVFAPAGGNINYKSDWSGRYFVDSLAAEIITLNPSLALRFDNKHSIGAGLDINIGHLRTRQQVDVDGVEPYLIDPLIKTIGNAQPGGILNNLLGNALQANGITLPGVPAGDLYASLPQSTRLQVSQTLGQALLSPDSRANALLELYGYGLGYNLGYLYEQDERTRISLAYRSPIRMIFRGNLDWHFQDVQANIPLPDTQTGELLTAEALLDRYLRPDSTIKSELTLPARTSLGVLHSLTPKLDLLFDGTFIQSSVVQEIRIAILDQKDPQGRPVKQGDGIIPLKWRDSFRLAAGVNYRYDDKLMLRGGLAYDRTPVPSPEFRHPAAPDSDRYTLALGANYRWRSDLTVDAGYSLIHLADSASNYRLDCRGLYRETGSNGLSNDPQSCTGNGGTFRGRFSDTFINMVGLQLNQRF